MKSSNKCNNLIDPLSPSTKNIKSLNKSLESQRKIFFLNDENSYKYENVLNVVEEIKSSTLLREINLFRCDYKLKSFINYNTNINKSNDSNSINELNEPQKPKFIAFHFQTEKDKFKGGEFIFKTDKNENIKTDKNMIIFCNASDNFMINEVNEGTSKVTIIKFY